MVNCYTHLEDYIKNLYFNIGITKPEEININTIANRLRLKVLFVPFNSLRANNVICINERIPKDEQWQQFGHELCHALWHYGNQLGIPIFFREYQEWKANNFALHFCVPTFMLEEMNLDREYYKAMYQIQKVFNVDEYFAKKRLDYYLATNKCIVY